MTAFREHGTSPPLDAPRDCQVYVFEGWDPRTNYTTKTVIYVGETGRMPFQRLLEHVYEQPWADTITSWRVLDEVYPDKAAVLAAEDAAIKRLQPLYNYEGNLDNPRRIPIPEARRQRAARDAARGVQPWTPPAGTRMVRGGATRRPVAQPARRRVSWRWARTRAFWLAASWLVLAVAGSVGLAHLMPHLPVQYDAVGGVAGATTVLLRATRRGRGRRRRR